MSGLWRGLILSLTKVRELWMVLRGLDNFIISFFRRILRYYIDGSFLRWEKSSRFHILEMGWVRIRLGEVFFEKQFIDLIIGVTIFLEVFS
jgi:hypothetical protein